MHLFTFPGHTVPAKPHCFAGRESEKLASAKSSKTQTWHCFFTSSYTVIILQIRASCELAANDCQLWWLSDKTIRPAGSSNNSNNNSNNNKNNKDNRNGKDNKDNKARQRNAQISNNRYTRRKQTPEADRWTQHIAKKRHSGTEAPEPSESGSS